MISKIIVWHVFLKILPAGGSSCSIQRLPWTAVENFSYIKAIACIKRRRTKEKLTFRNLLLLSLVVCFLFGTALQELLGKLFGFNGIAQINADKVIHFIRRLYFLQICHNGGHYREKYKYKNANFSSSWSREQGEKQTTNMTVTI